ncbi:TonB-dependent receptor [Novosphingobium sp.]|uniref:TonB-dependent receptor n=1 Tax=Novosphingobium sp. TaxID=1874826 RepID=UPI002FDA4988
MYLYRKCLLLGASSLLGMAIQAPAYAQDSGPAAGAANNADASGDIIVTAQKRAESINDVGMSITAVSGDNLLKRGVTDASQLTKVVAGFNYNETARADPIYTIRGVGFQDSSIAASPTVTVYVDEIPIPYSGGTLGASLDLQRVEVLKGPQGTLFGGNSTGGAINFVATKPTNDLSAGVNLSYGRFNSVDLSGFVSGPLAPTLTARLSGKLVRSNDWQRSYTRSDTNGEKNQLLGRLLLDWKPTDALTVSINANGWRDHSETQAPQLIGRTAAITGIPFDPDFAVYPLAPNNARAAGWDPGVSFKQHNSYWHTSGRIDYKPNDTLTLTSITSYQEYRRRVPVDIDGTDVTVFRSISSGKVDTFFQEVRLAADFGKEGHALIGANYQSDNITEDQFLNFSHSTQAFLGGEVTASNKQKAKNKAIFANLEYEILPSLKLQGGIRYTDSKRSYVGCTRDSGSGTAAAALNALIPGLGAVSGGCTLVVNPTAPFAGEFVDHLNQDNVSWRVGLNYNATQDVLLYANVSKGYKAGSYQSLPAASAASLLPVTQESVLAYEAGFKAALFDHKLQLNGAAFYYDYKNKQIRGIINIPIFGNGEALINVPKSRIAGFELNAILRPVSGLTISPSITLVASKVRSSLISGTPDGTVGQFKGEAFPYTPKWSGNTDVEYRWALNSGLEAFVGSNVTYTSSTNGGFGELPLYRLKGYALLDLRAGVEGDGGKWSASVWGRNVTNEYYWTTATRASDAATRFAGMPVTYGVAFSYRY